MSESDTTLIQRQTEGKDSTFFGVSIRAWLALMLAGAIVLTHIAVTVGVVVDAVLKSDWSKVGTFATIGEPLYSMGVMTLGFYFGQKTSKT